MDIRTGALGIHREKKGKIEVRSKIPITSREVLTFAYTPGVAEVCKEIKEDASTIYEYTIKANSVAVITDGSAVLGLGNIGPEAALPVMEGKAMIFCEMAGIDAFPICIGTQDTDTIIAIIKNISTAFGGINLEDIAAPRCFDIEGQLQGLGIPVMHDDQHGAGVVVRAALTNAAPIVGKEFEDLRVVICGAGAAGTGISRLLLCKDIDEKQCSAVDEIIVCDTHGIIYKGRENMNRYKEDLAQWTNPRQVRGSLKKAVEGMDVLIGVSVANVFTKEMIRMMSKDPIVFAMANPVPEIMPNDALAAGAAVVGTGRSDFKNQINNMLAFPGIFRGALDMRAHAITPEMKLAAARALASCINQPKSDQILPSPLDRSVVTRIASAVRDATPRKCNINDHYAE